MAKFKTVQDLCNAINAGVKLRALSNLGTWKKGEYPKFRFSSAYVSGTQVNAILDNNGVLYGLLTKDFESATTSKEEVTAEIVVKKDEIALLEAKLKYLEETQQDDFDEVQFKVWNTLTLVDNKKLSKLEKAKAIAQLIGS